MDRGLTASRWDDEYRAQRYVDEPPLPFVATILDTLRAAPRTWRGQGLYVGCGNGRNYLPLVDAGLDLMGLDVSPEALKGLAARRPTLPPERLVCEDFRVFPAAARRFEYVIALQVFQHGDDADVERYVDGVAAVLKPDGLFFLRVNSASTSVYHAHTVLERNALGGFTVRYEEGPKAGMPVHFYSRDELVERLTAAFAPVLEPREDVIAREAPKTGSWAQWETIWARKGDG
jgi:SAM-dependent methyltransferase